MSSNELSSDISPVIVPQLTVADLHEKPVSSSPVFEGRVIQLRVDEAELVCGKRVRREVVDHPGGVVVLPILQNGRIIFVEQYRYALGHTLLELPAGKLDLGEDPADAIRRELQEETGYVATTWEALGKIVTSPGFCNETLWLFKATGLSPSEHGTNWDEGEQIISHHLTPQEAMQAVQEGRIIDAKTICLLWWLSA